MLLERYLIDLVILFIVNHPVADGNGQKVFAGGFVEADCQSLFNVGGYELTRTHGIIIQLMTSPMRLTYFALLLVGVASAQKITTPQQQFGFNIGDDYRIASYTQLESYWKKLATESNRVKLADIGLTAEGRHQWMLIMSAPENLAKLEHYRDISRRLARAEGLTPDQAHALAKEGKAVVWVDGGLHATETVGSQQLIEMSYQMASRGDEETLRLLHDDILLLVPANPDGLQLVADWYMREPVETKRSFANLPRLYEKYIGHDNNRDSLTSNMAETTNVNRQLFVEWNPQLMYNHHQSGPAGEVIFIPPFRDPVNHNLDALVTLGIQSVGTAMHERLVAQGKGGSGMRTQANYDGWWDGGIRNTCTYHNTISILTEIIGGPAPMEIPLIPEKQLYISDLPLPVRPQAWHYRQSIDYEMETNRAMLDYASKNRETLLFNFYRMGMNSIERGSRDNWTITPKRIEALKEAAAEISNKMPAGRGGGVEVASDAPGGGRGAAAVPAELYDRILHDPTMRDARGYIMTADQGDFPTVVKFVNMLLKNGLEVRQASAAFTVAGKNYPAGSYVVKSAQAFRPMVREMFEPQDHPVDAAYPGGPPVPPYDIAGWTLAMQMGVQYDRVMDGFEGTVCEGDGDAESAAGADNGSGESGGLSDQPSNQQQLRADQPAAQGTGRRVLDEAGGENGRERFRDGDDLGSGVGGGAAGSAAGRAGAGHCGVCRCESSGG